MAYTPTGRLRIQNVPSPSERLVNTAAVPVLRAVTRALGTTLPLESVTIPVKEPYMF